jgi:hypothetical protein
MYVKWKNGALTGSPVCLLPLREMSALLPLQAIIDQLKKKAHGRPGKPRVTRPLELILWENVVYLADDVERQTASDVLRTKIGLTPAKILAASTKALLAVTSLAGIVPEPQVEKLRLIPQSPWTNFRAIWMT